MSIVKDNVVAGRNWLRSYYSMRFAFSAGWIAAAALVGRQTPVVAGGLLVAYPAWDAVANLLDARQSGGLARSPSQAINVALSAITTVAVGYGLGFGLHAVLGIFGAWAILAGVLQLVTGVRRWSTGAQWAMIPSGAQSMLVGGVFIKQATGSMPIGIMDVVPYAAFGAFYFLVSAAWLALKRSQVNSSLVVA